MPEFYMLSIAVWLLYNYHTSSRPHFLWIGHILPYFRSCVMISSSNIFKMINKLLSWALSSIFNQFDQDLTMYGSSPILQFPYCHLYVCITWQFNIRFCSVYRHCPLLSTVTLCSILQFKVLLIIFRPTFPDFLFIS